VLKKALSVLAFSCFITTFLFGQTTPPPQRRVDGYIRGKVIIADNHGADQRIEVRLEKSTVQVLMTTFTDAAGNFEFRSLAPGSYTVSIDLEGYEPVRQSVDVFNNLGSNSVTIFLNKPAVTIKERPTGLDADDPDIVDVSQMKDSLPKKAVQDYEKAIDEKQKGRMESAVKLLEEAIRLAPNFFHAHNNLGILYLSAKRFGEAEREFKESHQLNPKTERPLVNLGSLYIEEASLEKSDKQSAGKLLDQALDNLEQSVKLNPRSALGYFLLGQANYRSSFLEEAEAAFKKARELNPSLSAARLMLANIYVQQSRWADVVENLDAYLKENPKAADRASVEEMRDRISKGIQPSDKQ
jgi:tetratricopeptide (TPR) repeat protein